MRARQPGQVPRPRERRGARRRDPLPHRAGRHALRALQGRPEPPPGRIRAPAGLGRGPADRRGLPRADGVPLQAMSEPFDLLVRGAPAVLPAGAVRADIACLGGRIVKIGAAIEGAAREEVDAEGQHVIAGIIDSHLHFNEPGRTEWEGLETGSASLAAGGGTAFFDMPLNSLPPVTDAASLALKRAAAERSSRTDFALWGGLVPGNADQLGPMRDAGAIGFKAFMCSSGVDE